MAKPIAKADLFKVSAMILFTFGIASAGLISSIQSAAAASSANLWAVPVNSRIDDGNFQILRLHFNLDTGNPLEKIRITLDEGTGEQKVLEFNGNGDVLVSDPAFVSVDGSIEFITDGYSLSKLKGKFKIAIDKTELTVGEHDALAEIITDSETITDDAHFRLRAGGGGGTPDLVVESFAAPSTIIKEKKHNAFVKEANEGTGNAGDHSIKIFASLDDTLDGSDILVGEKEVNGLKAGKDRMVSIKFELPEDAYIGIAYLIAHVDADEDVDESDEGNNTLNEAIDRVDFEDDEGDTANKDFDITQAGLNSLGNPFIKVDGQAGGTQSNDDSVAFAYIFTFTGGDSYAIASHEGFSDSVEGNGATDWHAHQFTASDDTGSNDACIVTVNDNGQANFYPHKVVLQSTGETDLDFVATAVITPGSPTASCPALVDGSALYVNLLDEATA